MGGQAAEHPNATTDEEAGADDDQVWLDDDGYPTTWGIAQLRGFTGGTPEQFIGMVRQMWWLPQLIETTHSTDRGRPIVRIRLVTGGWSGNEEVISEIDTTFFNVFYWESSHRGGVHVYEVPEKDWQANAVIALGALPGSYHEQRLLAKTVEQQGK